MKGGQQQAHLPERQAHIVADGGIGYRQGAAVEIVERARQNEQSERDALNMRKRT